MKNKDKKLRQRNKEKRKYEDKAKYLFLNHQRNEEKLMHSSLNDHRDEEKRTYLFLNY
jgi:hypothetical protein